MRDLPTDERYAALLAGLTPDARMDFDAVAHDIAAKEIDTTRPDEWRQLAAIFASRVGQVSQEESAIALMIAACMVDCAVRLQDGNPSH